ncbi:MULTISPECIES: hypothetical protein [unclassified Delftia]|uniref:hypothetical protein n=1 Tax=unclassified Delftia TaxID=2613839 RepID=UPI001902A8DA|nr:MULTISPECIES: hypothetical protein [unclassified Delftia]MBK0114496.1 hypothetical protein [Delftia sp. S65]MBK0116567.1 hypothetical protein [Delftia sp. S67]MBK0131793.1 hypothetical protein [Delftia sp. S66]
MKTYNKLVLGSEILVDASETYKNANCDAHFARAILLAGAVLEIIRPLLEELKIDTPMDELADLAHMVEHGIPAANKDDRNIYLRFYKATYNSLKHAGKDYGRNQKKASDDLEIEADLQEEARELIDFAIRSFKRLPLSLDLVAFQLSDKFLDIVHSHY